MQTKAQIGQTLSLSLSLVSAGLNRLLSLSALFIFFSLSNFAIAESSGAFVGIEVGEVSYGRLNYEDQQQTLLLNGTTQKYNRKHKGSWLGYGITAGYKYFFTQGLGIRAYANFNHIYGSIITQYLSGDSQEKRLQEEQKVVNLFNYGVNIDFLGNFLSAKNMDIGGFLGFGIGANSLYGRDIKSLQNEDKANAQKLRGLNVELKTPAATFDVSLNVGLRANLAKHHGIEAVARVPFIPAKISELKTQTTSYIKLIESTWNLNVRYTYSF